MLLILAATFAAAGSAPATAQEGNKNSNVVLVMSDDLDKASLERMPNIKSLIADEGATFDNYYVSEALCCPSRSTYLLGEYVHNHGVGGNNPPGGGYETFRKRGHEQRTIATLLKQGGYATGLFGKYMNGYDSKRHVPPGWDRWFAKFNQKRYEWYANANGTVRYFAPNPATTPTTSSARGRGTSSGTTSPAARSSPTSPPTSRTGPSSSCPTTGRSSPASGPPATSASTRPT